MKMIILYPLGLEPEVYKNCDRISISGSILRFMSEHKSIETNLTFKIIG